MITYILLNLSAKFNIKYILTKRSINYMIFGAVNLVFNQDCIN